MLKITQKNTLFDNASIKTRDEKHTVEYVHYTKIFPAQIRYSRQNTIEKMANAIQKGGAKHHHNMSILSKKKCLPVVEASFGYVLIDGHHDVIASLQLNANMIPIKIIADLRHLSVEEFWQVAEKSGWAYLYTANGQKALPPNTFFQLVEDSNRYFAAITARKYFSNKEGSYSSKGATYPVWIKINKDIPFIEFKIANALFSQGFIYNIKKMGNPPNNEIIEQARKILLDANIEGLRVIPDRIHYEAIELQPELSLIKCAKYI